MIGVILTVYDEDPQKVIFALTNDWRKLCTLTDADQELLDKVRIHVFSLYEQQLADNMNLIRMAQDVDQYMQQNYPHRYNGQIRLRRGNKNPVEDVSAYGPYKYTYIAV